MWSSCLHIGCARDGSRTAEDDDLGFGFLSLSISDLDFFRKFQHIAFALDDSFLSSDQDTNQFLV